ncbi:Hypothetical protein, conserved [Brucella ceti str. Cudo]|uniref:Uncharacterized protein n=1 Tax=Brucella ceti str. Cudo TaxID=595497 RepID=C0G928_9HYPH|nr:Hypothetical protein, conserved [Brucella ceti str. Cudo]
MMVEGPNRTGKVIAAGGNDRRQSHTIDASAIWSISHFIEPLEVLYPFV